MEDKRIINCNGNFYSSADPVFLCNNRAFLYGDALFETIACFNGKIPFLKDHISRLKSGMEILKMRVPFQFSEEFFRDQIGSLNRKNKYFKGVRIRITVFRNAGGLFTPDDNNVSYFIDSKVLPEDHFVLNKKGYSLGVFKDIVKSLNILSGVKSTNDLLYILAGIYRKQKNLDDCILINENNYICETLSSNIFLIKDNKIYTPSIQSGCLPGVMRKNIIQISRKTGIALEEVSGLTIDHVYEADECFITNAVNGIRWISVFKDKRYFNNTAVLFTRELNKLVINS